MKDCRTDDVSALHGDGGACPTYRTLNWYAVQVRTGSEYITAQLCKSMINQNVLTDCFIPRLTKILGNGMEFIPLKKEEVEFLTAIGSEEHLTGMSKGYIAGDRIIITEGPMKEMAGQIRFIDRHKRLAVVQMEMFGRKMDIRLGLEIVKKII